MAALISGSLQLQLTAAESLSNPHRADLACFQVHSQLRTHPSIVQVTIAATFGLLLKIHVARELLAAPAVEMMIIRKE